MPSFVVLGAPAPKGSMVAFMGKHGLVTKHDSTRLAAWTRAVGWAARAARVPLAPAGTPVRIAVTFQFAQPKRPVREHPTVRPDADKLARALLDALTGVAYEDDSQVVRLEIFKVYGPDAQTTVQVEALDVLDARH